MSLQIFLKCKAIIARICMFTLIELLVYNTYIDINPFRSTIRWQIRSEGGRFFVLLDKNKYDT
ncbi:hypothetical protein NB11A_06790 [Ligilactobacillus agilis]|nr:hypothetical protein NB11A_06790 [Ligilactobacillus agilis]